MRAKQSTYTGSISYRHKKKAEEDTNLLPPGGLDETACVREAHSVAEVGSNAEDVVLELDGRDIR